MKTPPYRIWVALMIIWSAAMLYNFYAVTLIATMNRKVIVSLENGTKGQEPPPDYGPRYSWNEEREGELLKAFNYGYTASSLLGGPIAEFFGPYCTVFVSTLTCGIFSTLCIMISWKTWTPIIYFRVIIGVGGGMLYPSLQCLIGRWAPPHERVKFVSCLMGSVLGAFMSYGFLPSLVKRMGWSSALYFFVCYVILFLIGWSSLVANYPDKSWFCSKEEVEYIIKSQHGVVKKGWCKPPLFKMITSIPFLAMVACHFGNIWGLYMMLAIVPKFIAHMYHFDLMKAGFLSATPSLSRLIFGIMFGILADFLAKKEIEVAYIRKFFILFSHILPGLMFMLYFVIGDSVTLAILTLTLVTAFNGATVATDMVNPHDLAPNFAATQYGIMNSIGTTAGFIIPYLVPQHSQEKDELKEWLEVFCITAIIYIASGVLFIFHGSVELQPWNEKKIKRVREAAA